MITLEKAKEITNEKVATLKEDFRKRVVSWLSDCLDSGIHVYVYEGYRSCSRQDELYSQGRETDGQIVTYARGGQSFHNYGRAVDTVPLVPNGKAEGLWEAGWDEDTIYDRMTEIAAKHGLATLKFETGHYQDANFKNWQELKEKDGLA